MRFVDNNDGTVDCTFSIDKAEALRFMARLVAAWEAIAAQVDGPTVEAYVTVEQLAATLPQAPPLPPPAPASVLPAVDATWRTCLEVAKRCSLDGKTVGGELKRLVKAGSVEAQGSNRGKRYRLVDDSTAEVAAE